MSYEIVYDKQFVKVNDNGEEKFCPFILAGSNNCYEATGGRRARSWWNFTWLTNGRGFATAKDMLKRIDEERAEKIKGIEERNKKVIEKGESEQWLEKYSDDRWGYFTGIQINGTQSTFGNYKGIAKIGCKKAVTVEKLKEFGGSIVVSSGYNSEEKLKKVGKKEVNVLVSTSDELAKEYYKAVEYLKGTSCQATIEMRLSEEAPKFIRQNLFKKPKKEKKQVIVDNFYVVKDFKEDRYVAKMRKRGYSFSMYDRIGAAKKFRLPGQAKQYAKKLNEKMGERFICEIIKEKKTFYV